MKEPKDLKVAELKDELQSRGLSTKGLKKDLVERLEEALKDGQSIELQSEPGLESESAPESEPELDSQSKAASLVGVAELASVPLSPFHSTDAIVAEEHQNLDIEATGASSIGLSTQAQTARLTAIDQHGLCEHHNAEKQVAKPRADDTGPVALEKKLESGRAIAVDYGEEDSGEIDIMDQGASTDHLSKRKNDATSSREDHAKRAKTETHDTANGHAVGEILHLTELVRPFTASQLQGLLETFGCIEDLWMNSIKSQCYVKYSSRDELMLAKDGLAGQLWPKDTGRLLKVELRERAVALSNIQDEHERTGTGHKIGFAEAKTEAHTKPSSESAAGPEPDLQRPSKAAYAAAGPFPIEEKVNLSLRDIFKLTLADPPLYYLPHAAHDRAERRLGRRAGHHRSRSRH